MSAINSLASLLEASKPSVVVAEVAGLGAVSLQVLPLSDRLALQAMNDEDRAKRIGPFLVVKSLVDQSGKRLLSDADEDKVLEFSGTIVDSLVNTILVLNRMAGGDADPKN